LAAVFAGTYLLLAGPGRQAPAPAVKTATAPAVATISPSTATTAATSPTSIRPESRNVEVEASAKTVAASPPTGTAASRANTSAPQSRNVEVETTAREAAESGRPPAKAATAAVPPASSPSVQKAPQVAQAPAPAAAAKTTVAPPVTKAASSEARGTKMKIETVTSPGGIKAWLVEERSVPLVAVRFAFDGGSSQDPAGKEGVSNFLSGMLDEGAGDLNAQSFQERMEEIAMRMGFEGSRDHFYGSFETLTVNRAKAVELLTLAINKPRFDADAAERVRKQLLAGLAYSVRNPDRVASREWSRTAFPNHPYGRPTEGTPESVAAITPDDLRTAHKRMFARNTLRVVAVGDINATDLAAMLDQIFGGLPAKADLAAVAKVAPLTGGVQRVVEMDVPQSVAIFGANGIARKDPDFIPAFVVNQILGGGGFASRLMEEVREKRGLAYSVYSYLQPMQAGAYFGGGVSTKNEEIGQSLDVIRAELKKMADEGPTPQELENARSYLIGSYALRFDTNAKIANQLLAIQQEDLGIDYVERRNKEVAAVTIDDVKRVARRLLKTDDLIVTIVGKPKNLAKP
jgi:zinc protease